MASSSPERKKSAPRALDQNASRSYCSFRSTMYACLCVAFIGATVSVATGTHDATTNFMAQGHRARAASMPMSRTGMAASAASDMAVGSDSYAQAGSASPPDMMMPQIMSAKAMGGEGRFQSGAMSSVVQEMQEAGNAAGTVNDGVLSGPVVLKTASVNVEARDVKAVMSSVQSAVESMGGYVESGGSSTDEWLIRSYERIGAEPPKGPTHGNMQLRVPAAKLDSARAAVFEAASASSGRVSGESSHGQDVTGQYVDTVARQRVDEKALAQLEALLKSANSVQDVLQVKREMDMVVARLEGSKASRKFMEGRSVMSSLSVNVAVPQPPAPEPAKPKEDVWTWAATWTAATTALGKAGQGAASIAVYTLVFAAPLCILGGLLFLVVNRVLGPALSSWKAGARAQEGYVVMR